MTDLSGTVAYPPHGYNVARDQRIAAVSWILALIGGGLATIGGIIVYLGVAVWAASLVVGLRAVIRLRKDGQP